MGHGHSTFPAYVRFISSAGILCEQDLQYVRIQAFPFANKFLFNNI